jgi:ATP-dependent RNA helicase DOB1
VWPSKDGNRQTCASSPTTILIFVMTLNDPFSFLDEKDVEDNESDNELDNRQADTNVSQDSLKKRKPSLSHSPPTDDEQDDDPVSRISKKPRLTTPKPVVQVVDEFETEAKREVAASAGLTGGVESESLLELRHQVCRAILL